MQDTVAVVVKLKEFKMVMKCACGYEMIEVDNHWICSKYFEDIRELIEKVKEKIGDE